MALPLVVDNGLWTNLAARLGREMEVAYFSSWHNAFPVSREFAPGTGLKGVERVDNPIEFMLSEKASHIIVPDLYLSGYEQLARAMELPVFGCGEGNRLETDRMFMYEFLEAHDQPVIATVQIEGVDELRKYLQKHEDKYVKVSVYRGDLESYHHRDWQNTEPWFDRLKARLGPLGHSISFVVQDPIPSACEVGIDTYFSNGWAEPMILGYEIKDSGYAGVLIDDVPKGFKPLFSALGELFNQAGYNCFFSAEMRLLEDGTPYMTDATCRVGSPPGGVMMAAAANFPDIVLKGDNPDYGDARYFCEIVLNSDQVTEDWLRVDYPPELAERYSFHNYCVIDGSTWIIPHDSKYVEFGSALGWGKTLSDAREMAEEAAEALQGDHVHYDRDVLERAEKEIAKGAALGLPA